MAARFAVIVQHASVLWIESNLGFVGASGLGRDTEDIGAVPWQVSSHDGRIFIPNKEDKGPKIVEPPSTKPKDFLPRLDSTFRDKVRRDLN
jgi:hypothetical protein